MKSRNLEYECEIDLEILGKRMRDGFRDLGEDATGASQAGVDGELRTPPVSPIAIEYWFQ